MSESLTELGEDVPEPVLQRVSDIHHTLRWRVAKRVRREGGTHEDEHGDEIRCVGIVTVLAEVEAAWCGTAAWGVRFEKSRREKGVVRRDNVLAWIPVRFGDRRQCNAMNGS
jgi:hypothetical protein